jgi:DMSO/TMAO reductase YedYZ molybdopterin-dependent catalytic subunit
MSTESWETGMPRRPEGVPLPSRHQVAVALLAGVGAVAGSFALSGLTDGFVVVPVNRLVTDAMPGVVLTLAILLLGDLGQQLGLAVSALAVVAAFAVTTLGAFRAEGRYTRVGVAAALAGVLGYFLGGGPRAALVTGLPVLAVVLLATDQWGSVDAGDARRRVLRVGAGVAGLSVVGALLGRQRGSSPEFAETDPEVEPLLAAAEERSLDVAGMDPLVSEGFYEVDINAVNPMVDAEGWTLTVEGNTPDVLEEETTFTLSDLQDRTVEHRYETLRCVGERLNGHKMDTAVWTGTRVAPLLEAANVPEECCVMVRAADGYYEEFPLAALREATIVWRMNGKPLPRAHGHPVRIIVPGHWGEISVKWVTKFEILDREAQGYWEQRGWHGTGPVNTVAKLHAVNRLGDGRMQVGGHAYAGTRGIERVEVSTDGGQTWAEATLSEALPGGNAWRQWKHEYDADGPHEVVVRATDGTGAVQPRERAEAFPSGPTGWVSREVEP